MTRDHSQPSGQEDEESATDCEQCIAKREVDCTGRKIQRR